MRAQGFEGIENVHHPEDPLRDHIDAAAVGRDIDALRSDTKLVHDYIEQTIAHGARAQAQAISFAQFGSAIDVLTPLFFKYYSRLTLNSMSSLEPFPQFNTYSAFTFPWDVTCNAIWDRCREGQQLPWNEIKDVYRTADQ